MNVYQIEIKWEGPFSLGEVIEKNDGGNPDNGYEGNDYGLYQIYGQHILSGPDTLLYIGKATRQTFSYRFRQHKEWIDKEKEIEIYLGRVYDPKKHSKADNWRTWEDDVEDVEKILIYKYTPNYNSSEIGDEPKLQQHKQIKLIHRGNRHNLKEIDQAPEDYT